MASDKKVTFNNKITIKVMHVYKFASEKNRARYWENVALDRIRFQRKITQFEEIIGPVLEEKIQNKIYGE